MALARATVDARARQVMASTYFILSENGPLSFTVRSAESEEKHRVSIGEAHKCTCPTATHGPSEPCEHVLFVLLKVFRVPVRATRSMPRRPSAGCDPAALRAHTHAQPC